MEKSMVFEIKDVIYILTYVISIAAVFFSARSKLNEIDRELKRNQAVIFGDKGHLNLVDVKTCKDHRDQIFMAIRRSETVMDQTLKRIEELNTNVLTIMIYLQIRPGLPKEFKPIEDG